MRHNEVVQKLQSNFSTTKNLKESGIPWLGKIPEHWEISRFKYFYCSNMGETILAQDLEDEGIPIYSATEEERYFGRIKNPKIKLKEGDFVIPARGTIGAVKLVKELSTCTQTTIYSKQQKYSVPSYVYYFLIGFREHLFRFIQTAIPQITVSQVNDNPLLYPPIEEQKAIADFLDKKTHQIEEFITKKQKLITLLEEKKQTLINQCVTQGLDSSISLKDSGVEWLGKIPTHWGVKKLKLLFGIGSGLGITKADFVSSGIPCVSYGEIHSKYPCRLDTKIHSLPYVSEDYLESKPQALLKKGDFVFADTSEDIEGSGNFTSVQSDEPVFAGYHTIVLKPKTQRIHSPYFSFLFDSLAMRNQVRKEVCGVKVYSITKSILREIQCLIPPLEEQKAIAEYLDTQIAKIDLAISKIKSQINLIKEYKSTLISEAVCGRIGI